MPPYPPPHWKCLQPLFIFGRCTFLLKRTKTSAQNWTRLLYMNTVWRSRRISWFTLTRVNYNSGFGLRLKPRQFLWVLRANGNCYNARSVNRRRYSWAGHFGRSEHVALSNGGVIRIRFQLQIHLLFGGNRVGHNDRLVRSYLPRKLA